MKIAWFSPLPPLKTGISEYSELIVKTLKNYAQVDLWVDGFSPRCDFYKEFKVIDYHNKTDIFPLLRLYDIIIYNMGNNVEFHSGIYEVLCRYPGIVILHDYVLHHFFVGYWIDKKKDANSYFQKVNKLYGSDVEQEIKKSINPLSKPFWETDKVFNYPLNEEILDKAKGIIVHSEFVNNLIKNHTKVKIMTLSHPLFYLPKFNNTCKNMQLPKEKIILASMGFISPVKRLDKVLKVIANNQFLKECTFMIIIGENVYPDYDLKDYINKYRLNSNVKLLGYLPLNEAYEYLNCSDICLNLRYPTMGETSGSLIRIMSLGKPTIVTNIGWYSEIPDGCAIKIDPEKEEQQLTNALINLVKDKDLRKTIGENSKKYIYENNNPEKFVQGLLKFISEVNLNNINIYYKLIDNITDTLMILNYGSDKLISNISENLSWCIQK
ncbi:MAG: glycosyltransferase [Tepidanaerobacteraceae bacterium]|jgi:glycosyltransferase involved in cell wall biosynthesis|nr:glycosyltransferase [Tepidanaerobacteraceae bacterium]